MEVVGLGCSVWAGVEVGRSRSQRCPLGCESGDCVKKDAISRDRKCNPKGKAAGWRKRMIC